MGGACVGSTGLVERLSGKHVLHVDQEVSLSVVPDEVRAHRDETIVKPSLWCYHQSVRASKSANLSLAGQIRAMRSSLHSLHDRGQVCVPTVAIAGTTCSLVGKVVRCIEKVRQRRSSGRAWRIRLSPTLLGSGK